MVSNEEVDVGRKGSGGAWGSTSRNVSPAKWSNTNTGEKNSEQPNVAGQFKPFGSANSCPQSIHSKRGITGLGRKSLLARVLSTRPAKEAIGLTEAAPPAKTGDY